MVVNPLTRCVEDYSLPPYAQLRPDDIAPALRTAMAEFASDLEAIEDDLACPDAEISWESVMDRLEIIDDPLERLWCIVLQLMKAVNMPELRAAHFELEDQVVRLQNKRAQSVVVYQAMTTLRDGPTYGTLTTEQQNAVAAGHVLATAESGPWKLSLESPVYDPLLKYCASRPIREQLYRANNDKAKANEPVVVEILQLRLQLAQMLGFRSFFELSLVNNSAPSVDSVFDTLDELRNKAFPRSQAELRQLEVLAAAHNHPLPLEPWDVPYWTERLRQEQFDIDDEAISQYFSLPKAADGLEETWHPDVRFFQIRAMDQPETPVVAQFYLDPYARPGQKRQGSFVEVVVSRSKVLRTAKAPVRLPVFSIVLNQTPPVGDMPSLMTFTDLDLLFGCVGFGLRIALTSAEYTAASGIDGIEADSLGCLCAFSSDFAITEVYTTGKRYRDTILALSGVVHPTKAFELFRGRKQRTAALLEESGLQ
ncbi:hypothetical protein DYB37_012674 [Aphanomyces astaci]|uniref:Uncharacterized protein n=1 Tax=Aphanomyces astaci TaxID=112090 RepID=A0A418ER14_APHAT|nr:hypothetical protein DYB37_012674 [Aphanomyces astaci]